jgi:hypothetical protein
MKQPVETPKKRQYNYDPDKAKLIKELRFDIKSVPFGVGRCVYKLYYGTRYIIWKGETLIESLSLLQKGYAYHVAYGQSEADDKQNKFFIQFYKYIQSHPDLDFRLEILLASQNAYELLKREQMELIACWTDKKCLNNNQESYLPKFREKTQTYGSWITKRNVADFKKFLKKSL